MQEAPVVWRRVAPWLKPTLVGAVVIWLLAGGDVAFAQDGGEGEEGIDWWELGLGVLGGLALFLYGVTRLARALDDVAGDRLKQWMQRFTGNRFAAVGTGFVATTVLDSSSVTIISVIAMVSAGLITFANSLGVVMGSNIGTTMSSILFATNLDKYAAIILAVGLILHYAVKTKPGAGSAWSSSVWG
ncbi:MAG: Na/Pi symporter [Roseiflexaceae bacterium]|nr:Na/Pi symporter [Roseiflexaceae bacterium]